MIYSARASRLRRSSRGYSTAPLTIPKVCDIPAYNLARDSLWFHTVRDQPVKKMRQAQCIRPLRVHRTISQSGPCGLPVLSIAHYGEQNGDLMRDPEMCFELGFAAGAHLTPFYFRNDYLGIEQFSRMIEGDNYVFDRDLYDQHEKFAGLWDKNLSQQGFLKACDRRGTQR
jgi:hypothetical protein